MSHDNQNPEPSTSRPHQHHRHHMRTSGHPMMGLRLVLLGVAPLVLAFALLARDSASSSSRRAGMALLLADQVLPDIFPTSNQKTNGSGNGPPLPTLPLPLPAAGASPSRPRAEKAALGVGEIAATTAATTTTTTTATTTTGMGKGGAGGSGGTTKAAGEGKVAQDDGGQKEGGDEEGGRVAEDMFLLVAPHLDDCAFSLGGLLARLSRSNSTDNVRVVTVMAGKPSPAMRTKSDRFAGFADSNIAMSSRLSENKHSLRPLGVQSADLGFIDGGYTKFTGMKKGREDDLELITSVASAIELQAKELAGRGTLKIFGPMGFKLSPHGDHEVVHRALLKLAAQWLVSVGGQGGNAKFFFYEDFPYVLKVSKQRDMSDASFRRDLEAAHNLTLREAPLFFAKEDMEAKHEQMLAYKSQMRYMPDMREHDAFYAKRCAPAKGDFCEMTWQVVR